MRFHVVTVMEGGADFATYHSYGEVPINDYVRAYEFARIRQALAYAEIGDEITLDGCSVCFVLKDKPIVIQ